MKKLLLVLVSSVTGILVGGAGVLTHNIFLGPLPIGLILALLGSYSAARIVGEFFGSIMARFWFLLGWSAVILRAGFFGNSDELLIMANSTGNIYIALGFLLVGITLWRKI